MQLSWRGRTLQFIFYPVSFSLWIVLMSYSPFAKIGELEFPDITRSLIITSGCTLLAYLTLTAYWKDWQKSAFFVWLTLTLGYTYLLQYQSLKDHISFIGNTFLSIIPFALWGLLYWLAKVRKYYEGRFTTVLEGAGIGLLLLTCFGLLTQTTNVSSYKVDNNLAVAATSPTPQNEIKISHTAKEGLPDIYYIILDGYARNDVLEKLYDFSNHSFLNELTTRGFYVAKESRANYAQTILSLASSLNFRHLHEFKDQNDNHSDNRTPLRELIHDNRLVSFLQGQGYLMTAFSSGISFTEFRHADQYIVPPNAVSEWESMLISQTPIPLFTRAFSHNLLFDLHKKRIHYNFDRLPTVVSSDVPHFIFLHVVTPHPPFVLGNQEAVGGMQDPFTFRDGSYYKNYYKASSADYIKRYTEQLRALNRIVLESLDTLLSHSDRPRLIILQSDHGPGAHLDWEDFGKTSLDERMSILNAFYIPDGDTIGLYKDITPVNTFRIILNHYFHTNLPLLKDESYFSPMSQPYHFIQVTDQLVSN